MLWRTGSGRWHQDARVWRARCITFTIWAILYATLLTIWDGWRLNVWAVSAALFAVLAAVSAVMWRRAAARDYRPS